MRKIKEVFVLYRKLYKSSIILRTRYNLWGIILINTLVGKWLGADIIILIYLAFSISILCEMDESAYTIYKILPINIKQSVKLVYLRTFVACALGSLAMATSWYWRGENINYILIIVILLISLIASNIIYYFFSQSIFKTDIVDQIIEKHKLCLLIILIVLMAIGARVIGVEQGIVGYIIQTMDKAQKIICIGALGMCVTISTIKSYRHMINLRFYQEQKKEVK